MSLNNPSLSLTYNWISKLVIDHCAFQIAPIHYQLSTSHANGFSWGGFRFITRIIGNFSQFTRFLNANASLGSTLSLTHSVTNKDGKSRVCSISFSLCYIFALSLHYLCTIFAPSLHHLCTIFAPSLHHLCTLFAPSLHPLCTLFAPSLHPLCTISAPSLHHLCSIRIY